MQSKVLGGILMILGTSIGAGMLALPLAASHEGFVLASGMLVFTWAMMSLGAMLILEMSLAMPPGTNLISMSAASLGRGGKVFAWVVYCALLYALLCAYIAGNGDILQQLLRNIHLSIPTSAAAILVVLIFASIVYCGIHSVDVVNRGLMTTKFIAFFILVVAIAPHIHLNYLLAGPHRLVASTLMVMITSYGFAIIVPSLREYFADDIPSLRRVVLLGSLLPLVVYLIWLAVIQGLLPRLGPGGLLAIADSGHATAGLMTGVSQHVDRVWLGDVANLFMSICAMTSFLGVSLCMTDFIADGLAWRKKGRQALGVYALSFLPPLIIVIIAPGIFIQALAYAGIFCVLLLMLLPMMMAYGRRYWRTLPSQFQVAGGRPLLIIYALLALAILGFAATM